MLATDGLWERLTNEEAVAAVESCHHYSTGQSQQQQAAAASASETLVEEALNRVAALHGMAPRTLKRLPRGGQRRQMHDDVCATVVRFEWGAATAAAAAAQQQPGAVHDGRKERVASLAEPRFVQMNERQSDESLPCVGGDPKKETVSTTHPQTHK